MDAPGQFSIQMHELNFSGWQNWDLTQMWSLYLSSALLQTPLRFATMATSASKIFTRMEALFGLQ